MILVTQPAIDRAILTIEQLRIAAGLASDDTSKDPELEALGLTLTDWLAAYSGMATDGVHPATFKRETIRQTNLSAAMQGSLILSRRPVLEISSATCNGNLLDSATYVLDGAAGLLWRLYGDYSTTSWGVGLYVTEYEAGYDTVPAFVSELIGDMVSYKWQAAGATPQVKRKEIVDITVTDYWVDSVAVSEKSKTGYPVDIEARILNLRSQWIM